MVASRVTFGVNEDEAHTRATSSTTRQELSASRAEAAVLGRNVRGVQAIGDQCPVCRQREFPRCVHLGRVFRDGGLGDVPNPAAQLPVPLGEGGVRTTHLLALLVGTPVTASATGRLAPVREKSGAGEQGADGLDCCGRFRRNMAVNRKRRTVAATRASQR